MSFIGIFIECMKEVRKTKRAIKQLKDMDLTEESLQTLANTVAFGANDIRITLKLKDGRELIFERKADNKGFDDFRERFEKSRKNRPAMKEFGSEE